jgi:hypothetical protein
LGSAVPAAMCRAGCWLDGEVAASVGELLTAGPLAASPASQLLLCRLSTDSSATLARPEGDLQEAGSKFSIRHCLEAKSCPTARSATVTWGLMHP